MPLITFESGELSEEIKKELNEKLPKLASEITGIPKSSFWLFIKELPDENISIGGKTLDLIRKDKSKK
ncbi:MAG: tautomerase family protein [Fusobacteriota bacterium]